MNEQDDALIGSQILTAEDLSNYANGAMARMVVHLHKHRFTTDQATAIVMDCMNAGVRAMREKQDERKPKVELAQ